MTTIKTKADHYRELAGMYGLLASVLSTETAYRKRGQEPPPEFYVAVWAARDRAAAARADVVALMAEQTSRARG